MPELGKDYSTLRWRAQELGLQEYHCIVSGIQPDYEIEFFAKDDQSAKEVMEQWNRQSGGEESYRLILRSEWTFGGAA